MIYDIHVQQHPQQKKRATDCILMIVHNACIFGVPWFCCTSGLLEHGHEHHFKNWHRHTLATKGIEKWIRQRTRTTGHIQTTRWSPPGLTFNHDLSPSLQVFLYSYISLHIYSTYNKYLVQNTNTSAQWDLLIFPDHKNLVSFD